MRAVLLPGSIVAAVAVIAWGCSAVLGIHDIAPAGDGGSLVNACGLPVAEGACASCIASSCCSQASACAKDHVCATVSSCAYQCPDVGCRTQCSLDHAAQSAAVPPLDQCIASRCSDACQLACGLPIVPSAPDAAAACAACMSDHACSAAQSCATDPACVGLSYCQFTCTTLDCHDACLDAYDGGSFTAFTAALFVGCQKPCQLGQNWVCLGSVTYGSPPVGPDDVTITLTDSSSHQPLPGVRVTACGASQPACSDPINSDLTDASGRVTLALRPITGVQLGFHGYFDLLGAPGDAGAAIDGHQLLFLASPLSISHARVDLPTISSGSLATLASDAKVQLDPTRGQIGLLALDCLQEPASHVTFQVDGADPQTKLVYASGLVLDPSATETTLGGFAMAFDVPPGPVTIAATPTSIGTVSSRVPAFVEPGVITIVVLAPTP